MAKKNRSEMMDATRNKLIDAARHAFGTVGYANISLDDLTAQAGLTRGALYHHFGNKEGLLAAVIERIDMEAEQRLEAVTAEEADPWLSLQLQCRGYLKLALEPEFRRIVLQDSRAVLGAMSPESQSRSHSLIKKKIEILKSQKIILDLNSDAISKLIYGMLAEATFWIAEPDADIDSRLSNSYECLDALLSGLVVKEISIGG